MDLDRLPAGAEQAFRESTLSCLIGHALAFKRLQQTAGMLFTGPPPDAEKVLDMAARRGDKPLVSLMLICTPLLKTVMDLCHKAEHTFIQKQYAREQAVALAAQKENLVKDVGGVYSNDKLIVKTSDPDQLIAAATIRHHTVHWKPPHAKSAKEFILLLNDALPANNALIEALKLLLKRSEEALLNDIKHSILPN